MPVGYEAIFDLPEWEGSIPEGSLLYLLVPDAEAESGWADYVISWAGVIAAFLDSHTHPSSGVVGLQAALDGKADEDHDHAIGDVTGLQAALDGKAAIGHGHPISDVTGLQNALDNKLESLADDEAPEFGGRCSFNGFSLVIDPLGLADHEFEGIESLGTVGEAVVFRDLLCQDTTTRKWIKAQADAAGTMPCRGMALENKSADQTC
ncbi:MAG: hypothetical protein JRJ59_11485, partial [Deltaproteobacteria bacterium]|nr:hypothetical protein [Deltaproteobacteria bacterium]